MIHGARHGWRWVESVVDELKVSQRNGKLSQIEKKASQMDRKSVADRSKVSQRVKKCRIHPKIQL